MFDKRLFLQHATNTPSHNKMTRAGVKAPFSVNEQAIPMNVSTNVTRVVNQQERDAAAPEVKEKLQTDALKRVTSSPEYASASEEERTKMIERGLQSIGDDPVATSNQFTSPAERDAAYSTAQDTRSQNIDQDIQSQMAGLSDEERMLPPSELRRRGLIGSRYTGTAMSQGRPADPADPFGAQVSGPEDRPADVIDNATRRESGPSAPGTQELFRAQDELSTLRQGISDDRRRRASESSGIMSAAQRDLNILDRSDNVRPTDTYRPTLRGIGNTIQRAGGDTPEQRANIISGYQRRVSERPTGFGVR